MSNYTEYSVKLTDGQKTKLRSAIKNNSGLTLRLKHKNLSGPDELMLTATQISRIKKSISNGTGADIKISKTQIRKSVKYGGNLFGALASMGARMLPYAAKAAPALATGALSAVGEKLLNKIMGSGITIPKKFYSMLPMLKNELLKPQIDLINKLASAGKAVKIKLTPGQIQGGTLGTLAAIGIPMAINLVSKLFGSGLQVDGQLPSNTANVYVQKGGKYHYLNPYQSPPFLGTWEQMYGNGGKKKKPKNQLLLL